ncbi:FixH family protein [Gracilibacillus alcaliphilus]|uniref:FixH family protein n=1 Tax=Gracilibacillus alcaliphilus TaxID=1401441 RepID=UPI00195A6F82|nr:FixH family protein [Gracilibacillus alcaliphilus]MBM7675552.1 hypothetical protein [Gracilibacillus alcaliphilus]
MKKLLFLIISLIFFIAACGNDQEDESGADPIEEAQSIAVDFELPETAETGESVELKSTVTYGEEELVTDAEEMYYEYWNVEDEENTTSIESTNNEDGTYTAEVVFEQPGTYEIYAHTTARELHTMPKKSITIEGEALAESDDKHEEAEESHDHGDEHDHHHHPDFEIHVNEPGHVTTNEETVLTVELQMNNEPYEGARVRYEVIPEGSETHDWIETEETEQGTYSATHAFTQTGDHEVVVHVTDDDGLHEHTEFTIPVSE